MLPPAVIEKSEFAISELGEKPFWLKGARVTRMGGTGKLGSTGFSKMSDRQVGIWETAGGLNNSKRIVTDQSAGIIMPFWSENSI